MRRRMDVKRADRPILGMMLSWVLLTAHPGGGPGESAARGDDGPARIAADVIIRGGTLIDGTGAPGRRAEVAVRGDRIVAVGSFEVKPGAKVIDASGLIVAPGFIDLHTHSDEGITLPRTRLNAN